MTIEDQLKSFILEQYKSIREFSQTINMPYSTLDSIFKRGVSNAGITNIITICQALSLDVDKLADGILQPKSKPNLNLFPIETHKIPLLGNISCGQPVFAEQDRESYIEAGTNIAADFCLRAKGESMIGARILNGDIVFVHKQPTVNNGEIAVVLIDDEATLKRVYFEKNSVMLVAENPNYPPLIYTENDFHEVRILGKAIAFQSDVR